MRRCASGSSAASRSRGWRRTGGHPEGADAPDAPRPGSGTASRRQPADRRPVGRGARGPAGAPGAPESVLVSRPRTVCSAPASSRGRTPATGWSPTGSTSTPWRPWRTRPPARSCAPGSTPWRVEPAKAALALARGPLLPEEPDAAWAEPTAPRSAPRGRGPVGRWRAPPLPGATPGGRRPGLRKPGRPTRATRPPLRLLMEAHVAAGCPAAALDAYARGRRRLDDDLGVDPAPETEALYLAVLRRETLPTLT